jgi:hypothetical protein
MGKKRLPQMIDKALSEQKASYEAMLEKQSPAGRKSDREGADRKCHWEDASPAFQLHDLAKLPTSALANEKLQQMRLLLAKTEGC